MLGEQSNISFVLNVAVLCLVKPQILDWFDHSIELARFTHAQFHKIPETYT